VPKTPASAGASTDEPKGLAPTPEGARSVETAPPPTLRLADVERPVEAPVHSLAIDPERGKVAALGEDPWLFDGQSWRPIPLPVALRPKHGERDEARIYFGRDYQPRIMGSRIGADGPRPLYLRFKQGSWREEPRELGAFAAKPHAGLYGVLGWDDPELVCKVGEFCLVKQRSGWSQVPLPVPAPRMALRIDLGPGGLYALLDRQLLRLGDGRWNPVGGEGPWTQEPAAASLGPGGAWVSVPREQAIYQHDGQSWIRHSSPVREPRGLWSGTDHELWIAGADGVGYFDGARFWRVVGLAGPVTEVIGRGDRRWFGGSGGVWSARHRPDAR
jgi:hypothetical protein